MLALARDASRSRRQEQPARPGIAHGWYKSGGPLTSAHRMERFIVVDRETRKILARFETREEAEAFRGGLIAADPKAEGNLSIREPFADQHEPARRAARKSHQRGRPRRSRD